MADFTRSCASSGIELGHSKCSAPWHAYSAATRAEARGEAVDIAFYHILLRPVAHMIRVTAGHIAVLGNTMAGDYSVDGYLDDAGNVRSNENPESPLARSVAKASRLVARLVT